MAERLILSLALLAFNGLAAPTCTTITDNSVINPDLSPFTGTLSLNLLYVAQNSTSTVRQGVFYIPIVNGAFSKCLSAAVYQVTNLPIGYTTFWVVPQTGGPYTIQQIESQAPLTPGARYSPTQLINGLDGQCVTHANGFGIWGKCGGLSFYSQPVVNALSTTILPSVHNLGAIVAVSCSTVAECGLVNVASDGTVLVQSSSAWTGTIYVFASANNYVLPFVSANTATVNWPVHGLQSVITAACYDTSGTQLGIGPLTTTPHNMGIGGTWPLAPDISIDVSDSVSVSGKCYILGN
jgi:hypothetical protein